MARLQLIIPLMLWALWLGTGTGTDAAFGGGLVSPAVGTGIYFAAAISLVGCVAWKARSTMRRTTYDRPDAVPAFHRTAFFARWLLLVLHAFALWELGFGDAVLAVVPTFGRRFDALPAFASIAPVVIAWIGLMAAQYPLDRSVREQNAIYAVEFGEPVRAVPTLSQYLLHGLRSQVLFTLIPLFAIAILRDGLAWGLAASGRVSAMTAEWISTFGSGGLVFILAPEMLRRVLPTMSLPPSPLRDRLVALSDRLRLGVRDVLLWQTHHASGNAAVMGVVPGVRYVLMTDLLVETMPPEELEAVFAHEAGHVVHRHIAWYVAFWIFMLLALDVVGRLFDRWPQVMSREIAEWVVPLGGFVAIFALFGLLSRAFERQADAFAARWMGGQTSTAATPRDGAAIFASALRHVAKMNHMPLDARALTSGRPWIGRVAGHLAHHAATWLHGSIRSRMEHVTTLIDNRNAAEQFETKMFVIRCVLAAGLVAAIVATITMK